MNLRELRQLAARSELSLNYIAKDLIISRTLNKLQDTAGIVFKGGTAINRVFLKKSGKMRFSEDIDIDLDTGKEPSQAIKETDRIVQKLKFFDKISRPRIMHSTIRYDLFYTNPLEHKDKVRLEFTVGKINRRHSRQLVNFGFVPSDPALLEVYGRDVLIRHKIECVLTRKEGKDIYDLYYLLEGGFKPGKHLAHKLAESLSLNDAEIKQLANSSNHYIPRNLRPDWSMLIRGLKEKLLQDTRSH